MPTTSWALIVGTQGRLACIARCLALQRCTQLALCMCCGRTYIRCMIASVEPAICSERQCLTLPYSVFIHFIAHDASAGADLEQSLPETHRCHQRKRRRTAAAVLSALVLAVTAISGTVAYAARMSPSLGSHYHQHDQQQRVLNTADTPTDDAYVWDDSIPPPAGIWDSTELYNRRLMGPADGRVRVSS